METKGQRHIYIYIYIYLYIYIYFLIKNIFIPLIIIIIIIIFIYIFVLYIYIYIYIRHVPLGTCCVTRSIGSSIHSWSSTNFQVELGAPAGGGSSSPFLWSFLTIRCVKCITPSPPPGLQKSNFSAELLHLAPLFVNLGTKMAKHRLRQPRQHHLGATIFQHSPHNAPKTASKTLQRKPRPPKNHPKCCSVLRFYTSAIFARIAKKVTTSGPRAPPKIPN